MDNFMVLCTALSVFGVGITVIDFLGVFDHSRDDDHDAPESESFIKLHGSYLSPDRSGAEYRRIRAVTVIMGILRTAVYFSLGFGPTGLFSRLIGLNRSTSLLWAIGMGLFTTALAWVLKRIIRRDLDSSIRNIDFLMETGTLLLPLEGNSISKIIVQKFGKETELYVKCSDKKTKLAKGKIVRIVDYDDEVYWVESAD